MNENDTPGNEPRPVTRPVRPLSGARLGPVLVVMLCAGLYLHWHAFMRKMEPLLATQSAAAETTAPQAQAQTQETTSSFGGIGAKITSSPEGPLIVEVFPGTPAARAGLTGNDLILFIDGKQCAHMTADDAIPLLRGPAGTSVTISYSHGGETPQQATLTREVIQPATLKEPAGK